MSTINVTNLSGRGGATPNLPDGANVTGVVTATSFDGSLKTTGTPTLGLGVTINASGVAISGVLTATTFKGDGSSLTGVGESIAPWNYNPDVSDPVANTTTGIGITFNKKVLAGSGTATLKIVNAGTAGTTVQSWGVSSCTFSVTEFTMGSLVSNLTVNQTYQLDIPDGFIVDSTGTSYVGTAYTFTAQPAGYKLWVWGNNGDGILGQNNTTEYSSPKQIPGLNWNAPTFFQGGGYATKTRAMVKSDGTLWSWGANDDGALGQSGINASHRSSPIQIGSGTDWKGASCTRKQTYAIKTDGTLWTWGDEGNGMLGHNSRIHYSSPVQVPGTTWSIASVGTDCAGAIKTDGTLWMTGTNTIGQLGDNSTVKKSSPVQIPGTTWRTIDFEENGSAYATKTDGTLWAWGYNTQGNLGHNSRTNVSSPVQIPGTSWSSAHSSGTYASFATRTDGTLWAWGHNVNGNLGFNQAGTANSRTSSPTQIPGTSWSTTMKSLTSSGYSTHAIKTDGTLWTWGTNAGGQLGLGDSTPASYSSPTQVGSSSEWYSISKGNNSRFAVQKDLTP